MEFIHKYKYTGSDITLGFRIILKNGNMSKNANLKLNQNYNPMTSLNLNTLHLKLLSISCNFDHNI